jgi:asparagine synthase (glutamine-hydrolysing)
MCGIAGVWDATGSASRAKRTAEAMAGRLIHRGPDQTATYECDGFACSFRRLAILDLTEAGAQPMHSSSGSYVVVFNGEIYNHRELRGELTRLGRAFRGRSDTEVLCGALEEWGIKPTIDRLRGMFAIAIWNTSSKRLTLVRDRLGIKPLYVYQKNGTLGFASESKALVELPSFSRDVSEQARREFLKYMYIPRPGSIWKDVRAVEPGTIEQYESPSSHPQVIPYWSLLAPSFDTSAEASVQDLDRVLGDAIELHLESDVPLGAFLSGGIDSSLVVALAGERAARRLRTFCVRFDSKEHDESEYAEAVAAHLGTEHTTIDVSAAASISVIDELPQVYDEPFADPSAIPSILIAREARQFATVVLTGDGGDEFFAGYNRYRLGRLGLGLNRVPLGLRRFTIGSGAEPFAIQLLRSTRFLTGGLMGGRLLDDKLEKLSQLLRAGSADEAYRGLLTTSLGEKRTSDPIDVAFGRNLSALRSMLLADQLAYLPDSQLVKVDRATMAASIEARPPLLDHVVSEMSWRLPERNLLNGNESKSVLRSILYRRVPARLIERPKTGFSVPIAAWLSGPLNSWASDAISTPDGLLSKAEQERALQALRHTSSGSQGAALLAWTAIQLNQWARSWLT